MDTQRQLGVIWSYRWWILLLCMITGVGTYVATSRLPHTYEANALVQLVPGRQASGQYVSSDELLQDVNNYSQLARTRDVADLARQQGNLSITTNQLQKVVKVTPQTDVSVLQVRATDHNPSVATDYANAYAQAFITYVEQRAQAIQQRQVSQIDQRVNDVAAQLQALKSPSDATASALRSELQTLQTQEALVRSQVGDDARLVETAAAPTSPASPKPLEDSLLAALGALVVGAALACLHNLRNDRYSSAEEVRADLGLSMLGEIPIRRGDKRSGLQTVEAFRVLRTNVEFALAGVDHSAVVVTSAEARSGKSFVTENLSRSFAVNGRRAVAVDADLHRPTLHTRLELAPQPGLGEVLDRRQPALAGTVAQAVALPEAAARRGGQLLAITAGSPIHDPAESLSTPTMGAAVAGLRRDYDVVVVDSPPLLACVDALAIARQSQGVILVVDGARGRRRAVRKALQMLRAVDTTVLGFVFNRADGGRATYYGYASYYGSEAETEPHPLSLPFVEGELASTNGHDAHKTPDGHLTRELGDVARETTANR